jgi:hypothetical protein
VASFLFNNSQPPFSASLDFAALLTSPFRFDTSASNCLLKKPDCRIQSSQSDNIHQNNRLRSRNQPPPPYLVRRGTKQRSANRSPSQTNFATSTPRKFNVEIDSVCSTNGNDSNSNESLSDHQQKLIGAEEWTRLDMENDEDLLFARLVLARLKKFNSKKRREVILRYFILFSTV